MGAILSYQGDLSYLGYLSLFSLMFIMIFLFSTHDPYDFATLFHMFPKDVTPSLLCSRFRWNLRLRLHPSIFILSTCFPLLFRTAQQLQITLRVLVPRLSRSYRDDSAIYQAHSLDYISRQRPVQLPQCQDNGFYTLIFRPFFFIFSLFFPSFLSWQSRFKLFLS